MIWFAFINKILKLVLCILSVIEQVVHKYLLTMNTFKIVIVPLSLMLFAAPQSSATFEPREDVDNAILETDEHFDPVEEMRRLLEQEIQEGEEFKASMRARGELVEQWEDRLGMKTREDPRPGREL